MCFRFKKKKSVWDFFKTEVSGKKMRLTKSAEKDLLWIKFTIKYLFKINAGFLCVCKYLLLIICVFLKRYIFVIYFIDKKY